jgi:hypothetical protein
MLPDPGRVGIWSGELRSAWAYTSPDITRKAGLSLEYVHDARLIDKGEQRLWRSMESGIIPVSVAVSARGEESHRDPTESR